MTNETVNNNTLNADEYYATMVATFGEEYVIEMLKAQKEKNEALEKKAKRAKERKEKALASGNPTTARKKSDKQIISDLHKGAAIADADLVVKQANVLCVAREKFETETLARSNKELYSILADVYKLFKLAVSKDCLKDTVKTMRANLEKRSVRVQANTNAITLFVRYVFNSDRRRAYNYASTLMAALDANVDADGLAEFIESKNGVEECKREFRKSDETKTKDAQLAKAVDNVVDDLRSMQAQQIVKLANAKIELAEGAEFVFVVARANADGTLGLLDVVNTTTLALQNAAVKQLAKQRVKMQYDSAMYKFTKKKEAGAENAAAKKTMREFECV